MAGNTFGKCFRVTTCGESHGKALVAIVDGCPPLLEISETEIQNDLNRRKTGQSRYTTQRKEKDQVQIISGVFEGKTTGTPIGLIIYNHDAKSKDYSNISNKFRPNHADYTYFHKYGIRDYRGGGRSSARETTMRVAAGAIARKYLKQVAKTNVIAYISQIGDIKINYSNIDLSQINQNPFFCPDPDVVPLMQEYMQRLIKEGNSIGARLEVVIQNPPANLGEPVFDKLNAQLAKAFMGVNAVKAVSIGDGFAVVNQKGTEHRDEIDSSGFLSNHSGGILGGISSGQDIYASVAFKPTSSIRLPAKTINQKGEITEIKTLGRHDPCVGIRAVPILEAMGCLTLMDFYLRQKSIQ